MLQEGVQDEGGKKVRGDDVSLHEGGQEIGGKEVGGDGVHFMVSISWLQPQLWWPNMG